jgi:hypothetical protein
MRDAVAVGMHRARGAIGGVTLRVGLGWCKTFGWRMRKGDGTADLHSDLSHPPPIASGFTAHRHVNVDVACAACGVRVVAPTMMATGFYNGHSAIGPLIGVC